MLLSYIYRLLMMFIIFGEKRSQTIFFIFKNLRPILLSTSIDIFNVKNKKSWRVKMSGKSGVDKMA